MLETSLLHNDYRLRRDTLARLRWLAIIGQAVAIGIVGFGLGFPIHWLGASLAVGALATFNIALGLVFPATHRFGATTSALILACDIVRLASLLYFTGGLQNPFSMLFLAPVLISAAALPPRHTIVLGLLVTALATALILVHEPLPWPAGEALNLPPLYLAGLWASVVISLAFISVYAWRVAHEARQLTRALSLAEMMLMRQQHLSALDGVAAAAAHKLGTPLGTIALVAREMEHAIEDDDPLKEDVSLLVQEAARCRDILSGIATIGQDEGGPLKEQSIEQMLEEAIAPHRDFGISITMHLGGDGPMPRAPRSPGLQFGLGNIIDNAAGFAKATVTVRAHWTGEDISISVTDDGPGFRADVLSRLGDPFVTTRPERRAGIPGRRGSGGGMGLGLFITKTLLERAGAQIGWKNAASGGAQVDIRFTRQALSQSQSSLLG